jgi:recombination protein RecR
MKHDLLAIEHLIANFQKLGGVGYKTAQRYAYKIIEMSKDDVSDFASSLLDVKNNIHYCKICGNFTEGEICSICSERKSNMVCVVKEPKDILALEKIHNVNFVYHVLHGCLSPLDGKGPNDIRIKELLDRIKNENIEEVLLATDPNVEGEATAMYIAHLLKPLGIKCTRLAQGIAMGADIEYADEITLQRAVETRVEI